jgi:hypothetical protein
MDGDSSADACFLRYLSQIIIMLCCGYKVKNLFKNLSSAAKRKLPDGKHQAELAGLRCCCTGTNHWPDCGCSKEFHVLRVRLMTFGNAVQAGNILQDFPPSPALEFQRLVAITTAQS